MKLTQIDPDMATICDDDGRLLATLVASRHDGVPVIDIVAESGSEITMGKFYVRAVLCGSASTVVSREA